MAWSREDKLAAYEALVADVSDLQLKGKKAIVTGASRGIGRAIAETLADEGADVAICARNVEGLVAATKDLEGRGARTFSRALDVADSEALASFINDASAKLGGLDVLVCNPSAGGDAGWKANFDVDMMSKYRTSVLSSKPFKRR